VKLFHLVDQVCIVLLVKKATSPKKNQAALDVKKSRTLSGNGREEMMKISLERKAPFLSRQKHRTGNLTSRSSEYINSF